MGHSIRHAGTSALLIVLLLLQQWPVTYVFGIFAQEAQPCTSAFCPLKRHTCRDGFCPMRRGAPPRVKGRAMHHGAPHHRPKAAIERRGAPNPAFAFTCSCERFGDTQAITLTLDHAVPPPVERPVATDTDTSHGAAAGERPADTHPADIFRPPERHG
jgi:hypothetical protein